MKLFGFPGLVVISLVCGLVVLLGVPGVWIAAIDAVPAKWLLAGMVVLFVFIAVFEVYKHFVVPDNRKALWFFAKALLAFLPVALFGSPILSAIKNIRIKLDPFEVRLLKFDPTIGWPSVVMAVAVLAAILCVLVMFVNQPSSLPTESSLAVQEEDPWHEPIASPSNRSSPR
jgi:hypothetical protein